MNFEALERFRGAEVAKVRDHKSKTPGLCVTAGPGKYFNLHGY